MDFIWSFVTYLDHSVNLLASVVVFGGIAGITAIFLSPLQFLKIIKQETGKPYMFIAREYIELHGWRVFFRGAQPYVLMQILSSAAFGVSDSLAPFLFSGYGLVVNSILSSIWGALFETTATIKVELTEIARNKKEFMRHKATVSTIALAIFLRNSIFWSGGIIAYKISIAWNMTDVHGMAMSLVAGMIVGIISIPIDVVATRSCGADMQMGIFKRMKAAYKEDGLEALCAGTYMRVIQIICYTAGEYAAMRITHSL